MILIKRKLAKKLLNKFAMIMQSNKLFFVNYLKSIVLWKIFLKLKN